jgi:hypothetical protein
MKSLVKSALALIVTLTAAQVHAQNVELVCRGSNLDLYVETTLVVSDELWTGNMATLDLLTTPSIVLQDFIAESYAGELTNNSVTEVARFANVTATSADIEKEIAWISEVSPEYRLTGTVVLRSVVIFSDKQAQFNPNFGTYFFDGSYSHPLYCSIK